MSTQEHRPARASHISRDLNQYRFITEVRVRLSETDAVGVAFFGSFATWFDVGRMDYLAHLGLHKLDGPVRDLIPGAVVHQEANFISPARYNDVLIIHVRMARIGRTSYTFHYFIQNKRDRRAVASGELSLAWLDNDFRPVAIPQEFRDTVSHFEGVSLEP